MSWGPENSLHCDMHSNCQGHVAMIDSGGYVYCEPHGLDRRMSHSCRKLRPHELNRLRRGEPVTRY